MVAAGAASVQLHYVVAVGLSDDDRCSERLVLQLPRTIVV